MIRTAGRRLIGVIIVVSALLSLSLVALAAPSEGPETARQDSVAIRHDQPAPPQTDPASTGQGNERDVTNEGLKTVTRPPTPLSAPPMPTPEESLKLDNPAPFLGTFAAIFIVLFLIRIVLWRLRVRDEAESGSDYNE